MVTFWRHPKFSLRSCFDFFRCDCPTKQLVYANYGLANVRRPLQVDLFTGFVHVNDIRSSLACHIYSYKPLKVASIRRQTNWGEIDDNLGIINLLAHISILTR